MCDLNEDKLQAIRDMESAKKKALKSDGICVKCKEGKACVVIRQSDAYCKLCFLSYATHKFRSTLGKSKIVKANDRVLVAVSGCQSSSALIHLVYEAISESAHKRLRFTPGICIVDESCCVGTTAEQTAEDYVELDRSLTKQYGYPVHRVDIHRNYKTGQKEDTSESQASNHAAFMQAFYSLKSQTAKEDFIGSNRHAQIVNVARTHAYTKIMFGGNATTLSIKLFSHVAQGRGGTLPLDVGVGDTRYHGLTLIRPMREFLAKEVAHYNRHMGVRVHAIANLSTMTPDGFSLHRQAEAFITNLQAGFPSTVSTVFRTSDKLSMMAEFEENITIPCLLCATPIIPIVAFGSLADGNSIANCESDEKNEGCCGLSDECGGVKKRLDVERENVVNNLCYGCRLTLRDMEDQVKLLPTNVLHSAVVRMHEKDLRDSIKNFLLDD